MLDITEQRGHATFTGSRKLVEGGGNQISTSPSIKLFPLSTCSPVDHETVMCLLSVIFKNKKTRKLKQRTANRGQNVGQNRSIGISFLTKLRTEHQKE